MKEAVCINIIIFFRSLHPVDTQEKNANFCLQHAIQIFTVSPEFCSLYWMRNSAVQWPVVTIPIFGHVCKVNMLGSLQLHDVHTKCQKKQILSTYTDAWSSIRDVNMHLDKDGSKKEFYTFIHKNVKETSLWTVLLIEDNLTKNNVKCKVGTGVIWG